MKAVRETPASWSALCASHALVAAPLSAEEISEISDALHLRKQKVTAVGIDRRSGESQLFMGDIRDVVDLGEIVLRQSRVNLHATSSEVSLGVYRLEEGLLVVMAIDQGEAEAAVRDSSSAA